MIIKVLCLILLLGMTWVWLNRGFFNALIHMLCTVVAGAIAFAVWEPLAYLIMSVSPDKGILTFLGYVAWGAGLLVPFAVSLLALRFLTDSVVRTKVSPIGVVDYLGGGICGAVAATITVGIFFIGYGFLPGSGKVKPIYYSTSSDGIGSLKRSGGLWIPAEKFTAALYGHLSTTSLRTGEPLADWYPDLDLAGYAINRSVAEGKAKPSMPADAIKITKTYFVGDESGSTPMKDLLATEVGADAFVQRYTDVSGNPVSSGRLFGVVIEFSEKAKESNGQVVMGNGQARLIMRGADGTIAAHPIALISQARSSDAELYGRFPFDSEDLFISSVGGGARATMGLEFVVPAGYVPEAISIKNTRVDLEPTEQVFGDSLGRFAALNAGSLVGGSKVTNLDTADATKIEVDTNRGGREKPAVTVGGRLGYAFEVRQKGSLEIDEENGVLRGDQQFLPSDLNARGVSRNVVIDSFSTSSDVEIVQVLVSRESPASLLGKSVRTAERVLPPQLVDVNGQVYPAVGFIYEDKDIVRISYDPSQSIRGLSTLPTLSSSRSDQEMRLVFRVSKGVEIRYFSIGPKVVIELDPPVLVD